MTLREIKPGDVFRLPDGGLLIIIAMLPKAEVLLGKRGARPHPVITIHAALRYFVFDMRAQLIGVNYKERSV